MMLGVFIAITIVGWLAGSTVLARDRCPRADEEVKAAKALLGRYRNGEDSVLPELRSVVEHCAHEHHRLDAQKLFDFYVGLSRSDRMRGTKEQDEFDKIFDRVKNIRGQHSPSEGWNDVREQVFVELGQIIEQNIRGPDFAPAAYALGFRATLQRQRIRTDDGLDPEAYNRCIESGKDDAKRSIELFTVCGMQVPQIEPLLNLAWFQWAQKQLDQAARTFTEVKTLARSANNVPYQARAITGLELIATERGDVQQRGKLLIEMASLGPDVLTWDTIKDHGLFLLELDEPRLAAEWFAANPPHDLENLPDWHFLMYLVTSRAGMEEAALGHAQVVRNSPRAQLVGSPEWLAVAELDLKQGRAAEVLQRLDQIDLPWMPMRRRANVARLRGQAHFSLCHFSEAASVLLNALEDSQSLEYRLTDLDARSSTGSVVGEIVGLESVALLARAFIESRHPLDAAVTIENWQSQSLRLASSGVQDISSQELTGWASHYEAGLITWVIGADTSAVVHVSPDGQATAATLNVGRHALEKAIRRLREAAFDVDSRRVWRLADEIQCAILPRNILDAIGPGGGKRILVCLHGALEGLPLDLLPLFHGDQSSSPVPVALPGLVGEASASEWIPKAGSSWNILGAPMSALPTDMLPGAMQELEGVAKLYPEAAVHTGPAFDRQNLLAALRSPGCLHLASHFIGGERSATSIDDSMSHAAILLSHSDRFTVDDVCRARPRLDLAVLNACYTAGGERVDAEPAQGIARAFLASGTRNILVTMWPIEDEAAARFALAFHVALNEGLEPSRAAMVARNDLRSTGASPAEWAAFRLIGRD
jgi:CHAT domain-containing protein